MSPFRARNGLTSSSTRTNSTTQSLIGSENGFTLIEVMVAMMVFAIIATGVAFSLTSTLTTTRDARSREVAANLAAQEIDEARAAADIFSLGDRTTSTVVDGLSYQVQRQTHWITGGDDDTQCGTGPGTLKYKRVNVRVTWNGMRSTTPAVSADTVLAPTSRVNDPAKGTILVSVLSAAGAGSGGVSVTATPSSPANGALPLTVSPAATDGQGCSYILKVTPGNYDVTISRVNYIGVDQQPGSATITVGVGAGSSVTADFQFDAAARFSTTYPAAAVLPTDLDTSYLSTYGAFVATAPRPDPTSLYPFTGGYQAVAGRYIAPSESGAGCLSVDPGAWTTVAPDGAVGQRDASVAAAPGGAATLPVRMGTVTVPAADGKYLTAVSQSTAPGTGDPGCAVAMTYHFPVLGSAATTVALPFGSWLLYTGDTAGATTTVVQPALAAGTRGKVNAGTHVVTLDPRKVPAP